MKSRLLILLISLIYSNLYCQCVTSYPYFEDFETGASGWSTGGTNSDWALGSPSKVRINAAGSGSNCWITGGLSSATYNGGQKSWLQSPCFDFSANSSPYVSFLIFWDTERTYDGGNLQYSLNGGTSWSNVGAANTTPDCKQMNWFNASSITNLTGLATAKQGWSGSVVPTSGSCLGGNGSGQWVMAAYCLNSLAGEPSVVFRFTFCSGTSCNDYDGIAIDSFSVTAMSIPSFDFSYTCESDRRVRFLSSGGDCPSKITWDFGDPVSGSNSSNALGDTHTFSGPGTYLVKLTYKEPCFGDLLLTRTVIIPEITAAIYPVSCVGSNDGAIALDGSGLLNPSFAWNVIPPQNTDSIFGLANGSYQVVVSADSACGQVYSFDVPIAPDAGVNPVLPERLLFCEGDMITLNPGSFSSYLWTDGSIGNTLIVRDTGWYGVVVTGTTGCTGSDSVLVQENCFTGVFVPTAFTPNDDGVNDVFMPVSGIVEEMSMTVYSRYGQEVFHTDKQFDGWDGTLDGEQMQSGIYVWVIKYKGPDKKSRTLRGWVMLLL